MILNRQDYRRFLKIELRTETSNFCLNFIRTINNPIARFLLLLRTCEYVKNCKPFVFFNPIFYYPIKYWKMKQGIKLGFSIPENVVDEGLQLPHYGTIVINANAKLGKYCRIHVCVNIGASGGSLNAPRIGNCVYIAPGAKIYGDIQIADNIAIAANAAVAKSFLTSGKLIGGIPAKEIGDVDISKHIKVGYL